MTEPSTFQVVTGAKLDVAIACTSAPLPVAATNSVDPSPPTTAAAALPPYRVSYAEGWLVYSVYSLEPSGDRICSSRTPGMRSVGSLYRPNTGETTPFARSSDVTRYASGAVGGRYWIMNSVEPSVENAS